MNHLTMMKAFNRHLTALERKTRKFNRHLTALGRKTQKFNRLAVKSARKNSSFNRHLTTLERRPKFNRHLTHFSSAQFRVLIFNRHLTHFLTAQFRMLIFNHHLTAFFGVFKSVIFNRFNRRLNPGTLVDTHNHEKLDDFSYYQRRRRKF